jgi:SAM-dependent methyltransferase
MKAALRLETLAARTLNRGRRLGRQLREQVESRAAVLPVSARAVTWSLQEVLQFKGRVHVCGTAHVDGCTIQRVQLVGGDNRFLASAVNGAGSSPFAFVLQAPLSDATEVDQVRLRAVLDDGERAEHDRLTDHAMAADPYHQLTHRFFALCRDRGERNHRRVLEIGSRARSGHVRRQMVQPMEYVGLDILPGENTDLVGDAHRLSELVELSSLDAVFALSTFEHLAMPWKAVIEINRVLRPGGLVFISSHQTFPLHDTPWDFWRFSTSAWQALFNPATGFRIVDTAVGEPAMIVAKLEHAVTRGLSDQPAFIASAVLAEKIADTRLEWPVDLSAVTDEIYPA